MVGRQITIRVGSVAIVRGRWPNVVYGTSRHLAATRNSVTFGVKQTKVSFGPRQP